MHGDRGAGAVNVAVPISLSGPDARIGEENKRSVELALSHFRQSHPNTRIGLAFHDDEGKPGRAQEIAHSIVQSEALAAAFLMVGLDDQLGQINTILLDDLYLLLVMSLLNVFAVIVSESRRLHAEESALALERLFRWIFVACYVLALSWSGWQIWR